MVAAADHRDSAFPGRITHVVGNSRSAIHLYVVLELGANFLLRLQGLIVMAQAVETPSRGGSSRESTATLTAPWWMIGLFIFPVLIHTALVVRTVFMADNNVQFGRLDLICFVLVVAFLCLGLYLTQRRALCGKFLLLTYTCLLTLIVGEFALKSKVPEPPGGVPWPPQQRLVAIRTDLPGMTSTIDVSANSLGLRGPAT